jgi:prepilin-type N-terminal cleavage/methylation domain-containing protein
MKQGFTLTEIIVAFAIVTIGVFSLLTLNTMSTRGAMDAYYEDLAFSLAREPLEVFRGMGFQFVRQVYKGTSTLPEYPLGTQSLAELVGAPQCQVEYPAEAGYFERTINITEVENGFTTAFKISVTVSLPSRNSHNKAEAWLTRRQIALETMVFEQI